MTVVSRLSLETKSIQEAAHYVREHVPWIPGPGKALVLGSGLGSVLDGIAGSISLPGRAIPHYPSSSVEGHPGELMFWRAGAQDPGVVAIRGRVHYYETGSLERVLFPVHLLAELGVRTLLLTNAAGGINRTFEPGDLMVIVDQINFTGLHLSPLISRGALGVLYDPSLSRVLVELAAQLGISVRQGVYAGVQGPSYETAAEVAMLQRLGADAVGMSTVVEASRARELGMRVLGISCITNRATGTSAEKLSHQEVTVVANRVRSKFASLVLTFLKQIE